MAASEAARIKFGIPPLHKDQRPTSDQPRPPAKGKGRPVRVDPETWATLEEIARREGLTYCGQPSVSKAIAWLVKRYGNSQETC